MQQQHNNLGGGRDSLLAVVQVVDILKQSHNPEHRRKKLEDIELQCNGYDERLDNVVASYYQGFSNSIQSFSSIVKRIAESQKHLQELKVSLQRCKGLLHLKRDGLKQAWVDNMEFTESVVIMDKVEEIIRVPEEVDVFVSGRHYLHATRTLCSALDLLGGELSRISALRDLRRDFEERAKVLRETLVEELQDHLYLKHRLLKDDEALLSVTTNGNASWNVSAAYDSILSVAANAHASSGVSTGGIVAARRRTFLHNNFHPSPLLGSTSALVSSSTSGLKRVASMVSTMAVNDEEVTEVLGSNPEANPERFLRILIESLHLLGFSEDAALIVRLRLKRELASIVEQAITHVEQQYVGGTLSSRDQPNNDLLLCLLSTIFRRFRLVLERHDSVLLLFSAKLEKKCQTTKTSSHSPLLPDKRTTNSGDQHLKDCVPYSMLDIWTAMQLEVQVMLCDYLGVPRDSSDSFMFSSGVPANDIRSTALFGSSTESNRVTFSFSNSDYAMTTVPDFKTSTSGGSGGLVGLADTSVVTERIGTGSVNSVNSDVDQGDDNYGKDTTLTASSRLVTEPDICNITTIFRPVLVFAREVCSFIGDRDASNLRRFLECFVQNSFLTRVRKEVERRSLNAVEGPDAFVIPTDAVSDSSRSSTLKPLLQSALACDNAMEELYTLLLAMPMHSCDWVDMMILVATRFLEACHSKYQDIAQIGPSMSANDADLSGIISGRWAADPKIVDLCRRLSSFPTTDRRPEVSCQDEGDTVTVPYSDTLATTTRSPPSEISTAEQILNLEYDAEAEWLNNQRSFRKHNLICDINVIKLLASLHESAEWFSTRIDRILNALLSNAATLRNSSTASQQRAHSFRTTSMPGKDILSTAAAVASSAAVAPDVAEDVRSYLTPKMTSRLAGISDAFASLADLCLTMLRFEIRAHCFYHVMPAIQPGHHIISDDNDNSDGNGVASDKDVVSSSLDPFVISLNRDIAEMDDCVTLYVASNKARYLRDGVGHLLATAIVKSVRHIDRIFEAGVGRACRILFALQQNLTSLSGESEAELEHAHAFYELLSGSQEDLISNIAKYGPHAPLPCYRDAAELIVRSQPPDNNSTSFDEDEFMLRIDAACTQYKARQNVSISVNSDVKRLSDLLENDKESIDKR